MQKNSFTESGFFNGRVLLGFTLWSIGTLLAMLSFATSPPGPVNDVAAKSPNVSAFVDQMPGALGGDAAAAAQEMSPGPNSPGWSLISSPNNTSGLSNSLSAVTCASASDCWAIGDNEPDGPGQTLIEHWNGNSWALFNSQNAGTGDSLRAVTCTSASQCWAVGYRPVYGSSQVLTLIERWNGTSWKVVKSPNNSTSVNYLNGVTCTSSSDCWAVGYNDNPSNSFTFQTLVEHWNGTSWTVVASPNGGTSDNYLNGVTCASASDCWAVGYYVGNNYQSLIEHWNGISWSISSSPNTNATQESYLTGVTCASALDCWAVGYYRGSNASYYTLIEQWNGSSWTIVTSPSPGMNYNYLINVSCGSGSSCWAVGYYDNGGYSQALIEQWNGSSWSIVSSPTTGSDPNNQLAGVACISASQCWAVGNYDLNFGNTQTLIEQWNGTSWTIAVSPDLGLDRLNAVTCASASDCWAVGSYTGATYEQTLIEHWNGSSWAIVFSPDVTGFFDYLSGVTCASASECWAVGFSFNGGFQTLIEKWNGSKWAIASSANATGYDLLLTATCVSAADCWAVGYSNNSTGHRQTLIEHWNGTLWSIVPSRNTSAAQNSTLQSVTCASTSRCWAVGYFNNGTADQTLIEQWNGRSWSIVNSPNTSAMRKNHLDGVRCTSQSQCWAVGYSNNGTADQTLTEQWNGRTWSIVSSPNTSATQSNYVSRVTCASTSDCWATGYYVNSSGIQHTLVEQWNGSSWLIVGSPNANATTNNLLADVTCASPSECWAVGYYYSNGTAYQTLIEVFR